MSANTPERLQLKPALRHLLSLFKQAWDEHPIALLMMILLSVVASTIPGLQIWIQKRVVDLLTELGDGAPLLPLAFLIAAQYATGIITGLCRVVQAYAGTVVRVDLTYALQFQVGAHAARLGYDLFEQGRIFDQAQQARYAGQESAGLIDHAMQLGAEVVKLGFVLVILSAGHWSLPPILVLSAAPGIFLLLLTKKRSYTARVNQTGTSREAEYTYKLLFDRAASKEIRVFGLGDFILGRWAERYRSLRSLNLSLQVKEAATSLLAQTLLACVSAGLALVMAWGIASGRLTVGDYVALTAAVLVVQSSLGQFGATLGQAYAGLLQVAALHRYLAIPIAAATRPAVAFPMPLRHSIRVENLTYQYPGSERKVLSDVSIEIKPGESVAIVGANGAGKTTLVLCLMGLLTPTGGRVLFDEIPLAQIDPITLRMNVTAVFQDFVRYKFTLRENVALGNLAERDNTNRLTEVAHQLGISDLVDQLPRGWETLLGKEFENSGELSGGQWQRIAIGRAILRDGQVVILDEPTSALDPQAELDVFNHLSKLRKGKTSVMITHRLGPARSADRIVVLKEGRVEEVGTHAELVQRGGEYAHLYSSQAEWYREEPLVGSRT